MKKITYIIMTVVLAVCLLLAGCAQNNNAAPSGSLKGPSASLTGTPYATAGPSSTVTIDITPLPGQSISPSPGNIKPTQ